MGPRIIGPPSPSPKGDLATPLLRRGEGIEFLPPLEQGGYRGLPRRSFSGGGLARRRVKTAIVRGAPKGRVQPKSNEILGLLYPLNLKRDLDIFAYDQSTGLKHFVPDQSKILAIDTGSR